MLLPLYEIGFGNYVFPEQVILLMNASSKNATNIIQKAKTENKCIDARAGRSVKSVLVLSSKEIILSSIDVKTLRNRYIRHINEINKVNKKQLLEPFLEIGFENYLLPYNVSSLLNATSKNGIKVIKLAKQLDNCIDCRQGRKTRTAIVLSNNTVILSAIAAETIRNRYQKKILDVYSEVEDNDLDLDEEKLYNEDEVYEDNEDE